MSASAKHTGLAGARILVVEDEWLIAEELRSALRAAGAEIIGPAASIQHAMALLADRPVDLAILDINLRGAKAFEVGDRLQARRIPYVFATGYDRALIPETYAGVAYFDKPVDPSRVIETLSRRGGLADDSDFPQIKPQRREDTAPETE